MPDNILLSSRLYETILDNEWGVAEPGFDGFLIGPSGDPSNVIAVWQSKVVNDIDCIQEAISNCLPQFPCGNCIKGIVQVASPGITSAILSKDLDEIEKSIVSNFGSQEIVTDIFGLSSVLVLYLYKKESSEQRWASSLFSVTSSSIQSKHFTFSSDGMADAIVRMRLRADIPILMSSPVKNEGWESQLEDECTKLRESLDSGMAAFGFDGNRAVLRGQEAVLLEPSYKSWKVVRDIKKYLKDVADQREENIVPQSKKGVQKPIDISMFRLGTDGPLHAPVIVHKKGQFVSVNLKLNIDVLVEVKEETDMETLYSLLVDSVSRQVVAFFKCLKSHTTQSGQLFTPEVFHFKPPSLDTPVSIVYPRGKEEDKLEMERLSHHTQLLVSKDHPCFRRACAGIFLSPTAPGGYLINPHIGLTVPNHVKNGTVSVVNGYYSYHHYMQDKFNDDKWGCAYRSLQTIISWFKYQGYFNQSIPTHREIQQALHDIGDKGEKFVGSRQWIGSFEVSFVLDHLLGVTSKFINVNSGAELASTGQELMSHFQTQGTPIMIGGGVLAHTILGVAYDEMTGDISFLILDPHYTGGEDLKYIQDKGWCGWKDMKFWDQTAHYNLCLPQRPAIV